MDKDGYAAFMSACEADPAMISNWPKYDSDGNVIYDLDGNPVVDTIALTAACDAEFLLPQYQQNRRAVWPGGGADIDTTEDGIITPDNPTGAGAGVATMEAFEGDKGVYAGTEGWSTGGSCHQVVQDGGNEVAGCGQFMQEMYETCEWPIYCPEGLIEYSTFGGGYCIEGDMCCSSCGPRAIGTVGFTGAGAAIAGWEENQLGWKIGAVKEYDRVWTPLRDVVCQLEPCGMGSSPFNEERRGGDTTVIWDYNTPKAAVTFMAEGTPFYISEGENIPSRLVGKSPSVQRLEDKADSGWISSTSGLDISPIRIKAYLEQNQTSHNLKVGDKVYIGVIFDPYGNPTGSKVEGNQAANGQHTVVAVDPPQPNGDIDTFYITGTGDGAYESGGRWFALDFNSTNYDGGNSFEIETSTKAGYVTEDLFIGLVEEAFAEWSDIIENLWSTHADFTNFGIGVTVTPHGFGGGTYTPHSTRVMGKWFNNGTSNSLGYSSSHDLKVRFINMGHEPFISQKVPVKIGERYEVGDFRKYTDDPMFGICSNKEYTSKADCVTNGQLYKNGCSANDLRGGGSTFYANPTDCWGATVSYCWDNTDRKVIPHPVNEQQCTQALQRNTAPYYFVEDHEGRWIADEIGTFEKDYGAGSGIFNPGVNKVKACVPKEGECCNGIWSYDLAEGEHGVWSCDPTYTDQTRSSVNDPESYHWIKPTNDYTPRACAKTIVEENGACIGQPFVQWGTTTGHVLSQCEYDCCGYGEAGWCMNSNGMYLWDSDTYLGSRQGVLQCRDPDHGGNDGNVWVPASWSSVYTWELNSWTSNSNLNKRHYGNTGGKCSAWPYREECCPRIGTIRVGMGDLGPIQVVGSQQNPIPITDNLTISYQLSDCDPGVPSLGGVSCMQMDPAGGGAWIPCIPEKPYRLAQNSIPSLPDIYHPRDNDEAAEQHLAEWENYKTGPMTCYESAGSIVCNGASIPGNNCTGFGSTTKWDQNWDHIAANPDGSASRPEDSDVSPCYCISQGVNGKGGDLMINSSVDWRPDYVPESADPGAYSIKRALMYEIGLMLGLRPNVPNNNDPSYSHGLHKQGAFSNSTQSRDIMTPVAGPDDDFDDISTNYTNTYQQLVELYELRHWDRGGLNDYTWGSGVYAGFFKSRSGGDEDWTKKVQLQNYTR
jgi:hypothetical protein